MYYKFDDKIKQEKHSFILGSRCYGKAMFYARTYYIRNKDDMTIERREEYKRLYKETYGVELDV